MDKLVLESKIEVMLDLLDKLKAILKEQRVNKKLEEYLLYAAEKKAEEEQKKADAEAQKKAAEEKKVSEESKKEPEEKPAPAETA